MKKEPMIKVLKGGDNFKMIDSKMDSSDRPALTTEAQNTQLIRTTLSSQNTTNQKNEAKKDSGLPIWAQWLGLVIAIAGLIWTITETNQKSNFMNINQTHYGSGDNVAGDKITINTPLPQLMYEVKSLNKEDTGATSQYLKSPL